MNLMPKAKASLNELKNQHQVYEFESHMDWIQIYIPESQILEEGFESHMD